jgi:hypothetical protein
MTKVDKNKTSSITFELKKQNSFSFATTDKNISFENFITIKL